MDGKIWVQDLRGMEGVWNSFETDIDWRRSTISNLGLKQKNHASVLILKPTNFAELWQDVLVGLAGFSSVCNQLTIGSVAEVLGWLTPNWGASAVLRMVSYPAAGWSGLGKKETKRWQGRWEEGSGWEKHMHTHGWFMWMYAKTTTIL